MSDSQTKEVQFDEKTEKNNPLEKTNIFKLCGIDNSEIDLSFQSPQIKLKKSRKKHKKHHHRKKNSSDTTTDNSINKEVKRKGVSFKKNLFEVIYVESFKQYNMENYQPKNVDNSVARDDPHFVKCCLIY